MRRKYLLLLVPLMVFVAGIWFYRWSNSPANAGTVLTPQGANVFGAQIDLVSYGSQYFTTQIPKTLVVKSSNEASNGATVGQYLFKHSNVSLSDQLGITIGTMQSASLSEVSAVTLRQSQPEKYTSITIDGMPQGAVAFEALDPYEVGVFWPNESQFAAVVVSGSSVRKAELRETLYGVIANWQWL